MSYPPDPPDEFDNEVTTPTPTPPAPEAQEPHAPDDTLEAHAPDDTLEAHAPDDTLEAHAPDDTREANETLELREAPEPEVPPAEPTPEAKRRTLHRRLVALGIAAILVFYVGYEVGLANDNQKSSADAAAAPPPTTGAPPSSTLPGAAAGAASALSGIVLQPKDTTSALTVRLLPGGALVQGQPTLDLCNGSFPSESLRVARVQDVALDQTGSSVLSTEAVAYRDAGSTEQAFKELQSVAAHCPNRPVTSPSGEAPVTTTFEAAPDSSWPQTPTVDRLAYSFHTTDATGQSDHSVAVYLRRGRILLGIYFPQPDGTQAAIGGRTSIEGIVEFFATRIAQLPASTVNG